ncbi:MAG: hypothetical protein D6713_09540 [Deltaproteobacteria bacterium]|nr:MAG: hypothetical protein D6713_09540 [Deltaproteobacteria bacterium]
MTEDKTMNRCTEIRRLISPYLDGELSREESLAVEEHLSRCGECRKVRDLFRALGEKAGDLPQPPREAVEKNLERARERLGMEKKPSLYPFLKPALAASVLGLLLVALYSGIPWKGKVEKPGLREETVVSEMENISDEELELILLLEESGDEGGDFLDLLKTLDELEELTESGRKEA